MIDFPRQVVKTRLLDPRNDSQETAVNLEMRSDPLTGRTGRLCHFLPFRRPEPPDYSALIDLSTKAGCPFCPELVDRVTPRFAADFAPEGHLHRARPS